MNSVFLNIVDGIVLVNVEICSVLVNCVGKFFYALLSFIISVMLIISMPLFTKCNFVKFLSLLLVDLMFQNCEF